MIDAEAIPTLNVRGARIPRLGFGTYKLHDDVCREAVDTALAVGYRLFDTARMYENEGIIGERLQKSGLGRETIYLTTKIGSARLEPDAIRAELERSLERLQTDYIDLLLIHWPNPAVPLEVTLAAFDEQQEAGRIRNYGVSNFPPTLLSEALARSRIICNQVECHPLLRQNKILTMIEQHDIFLGAYSPLGQGLVGRVEELARIGRKYGKSAQQVAIRWQMDRRRVVALPRSCNPRHIESNLDVFDFFLDEEDWALIESLPDNQRQVNPPVAPDWED